MATLTIGGDDAYDIVVDDRDVLWCRAELAECGDGGYRLIDLDSVNGTFVLVTHRFVLTGLTVVGVNDGSS